MAYPAIIRFVLAAGVIALLTVGDLRAFEMHIQDGEGLGNDFSLRTPVTKSRADTPPVLEVDLSRQNMSIDEMRIEDAGLMIGETRVSAYTINKTAGLVIAGQSPVTHIELNSVKALPGERMEVLAAFTRHGEMLAPRRQHMGVFDLHTLEPLEFQLKTWGQGLPQSFLLTLLLDASGSMSGGTMTEAKKAIRGFVKTLPSYARCQLITFTETLNYITPIPAPCEDMAKALKDVEPGGGTDLYQSLATTYREAALLRFLHQVLVVVTDGIGGHNSVTKGDVARAKSLANMKTLVFWAGNYEPDALAGLVDVEIQAGRNLGQDIHYFFQQTADVIEGQVAMTISRPSQVTQKGK